MNSEANIAGVSFCETMGTESKNMFRTQLGRIARSMRTSALPMIQDNSVPQSIEDDFYILDATPLKRRRVLLKTRGCSTPTCTMCPLPNEALLEQNLPSSAELIQQVRVALADLGGSQMLTLYNNGNFFADKEISPEARQGIYRECAASSLQAVMVESLPQFMTDEKLREASQLLNGKKLVVAIGLQSANSMVRELCINTICTQEAFESATKRMKNYDIRAKFFLMVKPPFLDEKEGIEDAIFSVSYLAEQGIYDPILCPLRVSPNTVVASLAKQGLYRPPNLWSVIKIVKAVSSFSRPRIALTNVDATRNAESNCPIGCSLCTEKLVEKLERWNQTFDISLLDNLDCSCKESWEKDLNAESTSLPLQERVREFLSRYNP
jgi:archaeosine synthase beta-subunit